MGFAEAFRTCFATNATFRGRARRSECWWFVLFVVLGTLALTFADGALFGFGTPEEPETRILAPLFHLVALLPIWWLTRPTDPKIDDWGPPPAVSPSPAPSPSW